MNDTLFDPDATNTIGVAPDVNASRRRMDEARAVAASVQAGREAQARADAAANEAWKQQARDAIERTARLMPRFTSDDVWQYGELKRTRENRALGPLMRQAQARGLIEATNDFTTTRQLKSHGSPARYWRSLIHKPEGE